MPGACRLRPCARTHLKKALCHTHPVGGPVDKYRWINPCFVQRLFRLTVWHSCWTVNLLESQGAVPPVFNHLEAPFFRRMPTGPAAFLEPPNESGTYLKKGLVPHLSIWWDVHQISLYYPLTSANLVYHNRVCVGKKHGNVLTSTKLILKPVLMYLNVFSYYCHT